MPTPPRPLSRTAARLAAVVALVALAGCGSPFEVELPQAPPRLVLQSLFAADSVLTVGVLQSAPAGAAGGAPSGPVTTASVTVLEDGVAVGQAAYVPARLRYVSDVTVRAGRRYGVRVTAPGFDAAEAEDAVPLPVPFTLDVVEGAPPEPGAGRVDAVTLRFTRPADEAFLSLYGLVQRPPDAGGPASPLPFRSADPLLADGDLTGRLFDVDDPFYQRAFFRVAAPVGPEVALQVNVVRALDAGAPAGPRESLRLAALSPTYYAYARARAADDEGIFDTPRALPSNVTGGYGVFAAFAATERVLP